jgi:hypothetical protein
MWEDSAAKVGGLDNSYGGDKATLSRKVFVKISQMLILLESRELCLFTFGGSSATITTALVDAQLAYLNSKVSDLSQSPPAVAFEP